MTGTNFSDRKSVLKRPRSLPVSEWPDADRRAWEEACRPGSRLKPGGVASYLAELSQDDFARRYGAFLGFLQRTNRLEQHAGAATQVTLPNVEAYIVDLNARVRSVTVYNCIHQLRRAAQLLAPAFDFSWLAEIEKDLALEMEPRSKFGRVVLMGRLVEAGMTLVAEAERFARYDLARARGVRNGLMVALLALCPIRLKNFAGLEIGYTFKEVDGSWWITLPAHLTKSRRPDERRVPTFLNHVIELYLYQSRPKPADERHLDLLHDWSAADYKEPRDVDLQNHSRNDRRGRVAPPFPHCCGLDRGSVRWEHSPSSQRCA